MKKSKKILLAQSAAVVTAALCALNTKLAWAAEQQVVTVAQEHVSTARKLVDIIIEYTLRYSFQVLGGIIVLIAGWILARFLCRFVEDFLRRQKVDITVAKFLVGSVRFMIMAFAVLVALGKFGIEIAPFIAGLSVIGFGTSFALQGPLSNYASGAALIFTKPFKVGDIIEVVGKMGEVEDISLAMTVIRTIDGTRIIIPNKHIIGEVIHNFSELKRMDIKVGVGYKTDVDKAIRVVLDIVQKEERIFKNKNVKAGISDFSESSVTLYARLFCKQADFWDVLFTVNKNIFDEFKRQGIEIPYPQRDVHIHQNS